MGFWFLAALVTSSVLGPRSSGSPAPRASLAVDPATYVGNVYGAVSDPTGTPIANLLVSVGDRVARTDSEGRFLINSIPAPFDGLDYIVTVGDQSYRLHVLPGATMALELNVQLGGRSEWHYRHEAEGRGPRPEASHQSEDRGPRTEDKQTNNFSARVFATREGLVGGTTANGHVIVADDHFVALPSRRALSTNFGHEREVRVTYAGRTTVQPVWDIGPWNTHDDYWNPNSIRETFKDLPRGKPEAEAAFLERYNNGLDERGRVVRTPAGIDLADGVFRNDLGLPDNDWVNVEFLWLDQEGPIVSEVNVINGSMTARVADSSPVEAAEFFVDTPGDEGTGTSATISGDIIAASLPQLPVGSTHTIFVRARDAYGNWGALTSTTITIQSPPPKRRSARH